MFNSGTFCAAAEELSTEAMLAYSDELAESSALVAQDLAPFEERAPAPLLGMGTGPERGPVTAVSAIPSGACCGRLLARFVVSASDCSASAAASAFVCSTSWL